MNKTSKIFFPAFTLIGVAFSSVVVIAMHFIRNDYNPMSNYISEYGIGKYGNTASFAFSVFGLAVIFLYYGLKTTIPKTTISKIGESLILVWGISMVIIGFFICDPKRGQFTFHGGVHAIAASIGFCAFIAASLLLLRLFKKIKILAGISGVLRILSLTSLVFLILFIFGFMGDKYYAYNYSVPDFLKILSNFAGLTERIMLLASTAWIILVAFCLLKKIK